MHKFLLPVCVRIAVIWKFGRKGLLQLPVLLRCVGMCFEVVAKENMLRPKEAVQLTEIQMMCPLLLRAFHKVSAPRLAAVCFVFVADPVQIACERFNSGPTP